MSSEDGPPSTKKARAATVDDDRYLRLQEERVGPEDFELLSVLGTGGYGKVFLVRKIRGKDAQKLYAMKVLNKSAVVRKRKVMEHTLTERSVLQEIRDFPFLVTLHYAFQTDAKLHLVMDYVNGGEMFTHLHLRGPFSEEDARFYICEIILALDHLHSHGIVYRDIKLENILLGGDGHVVLTDFGLSKEMQPEQVTYSYCGTVEYMAPEIIQGGQSGHDMCVDWWSLGVLLFELLTCESPFAPEEEENTQKEISRRILNSAPDIPSDLSLPCCNLLLSLLEKDPSKRLGATGAEEIKKHPWFHEVDWNKVLGKELPVPFRPYVSSEVDVGNFSAEFTAQPAMNSPGQPPGRNADLFRGYSFISPSVLFSDNIFTDKALGGITEHEVLKNSPFLQHYTLTDKVLGRGSFSTVKLCIEKRTGTKYAVKIVSKRCNSTREVSILKLCQGHPNIVHLHEVYNDELHVFIVMECLEGGELLDRICRQRSFTEAQASAQFKQLISAVSFMHQRRVVHRDLKPENLLFTADGDGGSLKVIDFGFARLLPEAQTLTTPCYTLGYAAPEVLSHNDGYTQACDLWSLGVILYTMLCGQAPFYNQSLTTEQIMERIKAGDFSLTGPEWNNVSSAAKDVLEGLLTVDAAHRLTINQLHTHSWLAPQSAPSTPLNTGCGLGLDWVKETESAIKCTFHAFQRATQAGFTLGDVSRAPLAKRRRFKKPPLDNMAVHLSRPNTLDLQKM
ncbi:hypothetical protein EMCRGX_G032854 [Ephydatia muelleri]|eukprot:Em0019g1058a